MLFDGYGIITAYKTDYTIIGKTQPFGHGFNDSN
jgi:hypothetical protein